MPALFHLLFLEQHDETESQGLGRRNLVYLTRFAERSFDDVAVIVVELHVLFEHVCGVPDAHNVIHHQFAEGGQEITAFVELLDLLVFIHVICNRDVED